MIDKQFTYLLDCAVINCSKGSHHGHPVEDDGHDRDQGEHYEHENTASGD